MPIKVFIYGVSLGGMSGLGEIVTVLKAPSMQNTNCWHLKRLIRAGYSFVTGLSVRWVQCQSIR